MIEVLDSTTKTDGMYTYVSKPKIFSSCPSNDSVFKRPAKYVPRVDTFASITRLLLTEQAHCLLRL